MIEQFLAMYRIKDRVAGAMPDCEWRMLLELAASETPLTTKSLFLGAGIPQTTALRHIGELRAAGLIHPVKVRDRRLSAYVLSDAGHAILEAIGHERKAA